MYEVGRQFQRPKGQRVYTIIDSPRDIFASGIRIPVYPVKTDQGKYTTLSPIELRQMVEVMPRSTRGKGRKVNRTPALTVNTPSGNGGIMPSSITVQQAIKKLNSERERLYESATAIANAEDTLRSELGIDPIPQEFIGRIKDYRFRTGPVGEMPYHTMRVAVDPTLVLWVSCRSDVFERNILREVKMNDMGKLNGKMVRVERRGDQGMIPMELLPDPLKHEGTEVLDKFGRALFEGARIYSTDPNTGMGTVMNFNRVTSNGLFLVNVLFDDRDSENTLYAQNLIRT